jgi:hypothetical protein
VFTHKCRHKCDLRAIHASNCEWLTIENMNRRADKFTLCENGMFGTRYARGGIRLLRSSDSFPETEFWLKLIWITDICNHKYCIGSWQCALFQQLIIPVNRFGGQLRWVRRRHISAMRRCMQGVSCSNCH